VKSRATRGKRLSKADRREQLLAIARTIVRDEGTDALTLATLAERAGVTRPITYEHFQTRSGLLLALARAIDDRQVALILTELGQAGTKLTDIARVAANGYMRCVMEIGQEWQSITAALRADAEMDLAQHEIHQRYADIYSEAFAECTTLSKPVLKRRCVAIIGAAEALARELHLGNLDERTAATTLRSLMEAWLVG
jgi:AcrR family transcriptional regulator